ncbi:MAG: hypothetical protein ABSA97_07300 [Verrucomicrobiia bacterium]
MRLLKFLLIVWILGGLATAQGDMILTNGPVGSLTWTSATVSVCIVGASTNSTLTLYWGLTNGFASAAAWGTNAVLSSNASNGCISTNLTGLTGLHTWYFNATASNGTDGVVWGKPGSFTTPGLTNAPTSFLLLDTNGVPQDASFLAWLGSHILTNAITVYTTNALTLYTTNNVTVNTTNALTLYTTNDVTIWTTNALTVWTTNAVTIWTTNNVTVNTTNALTLYTTNDVTIWTTNALTVWTTNAVTIWTTNNVTVNTTNGVTLVTASPDGTNWTISVSDAGTLSAVQVP